MQISQKFAFNSRNLSVLNKRYKTELSFAFFCSADCTSCAGRCVDLQMFGLWCRVPVLLRKGTLCLTVTYIYHVMLKENCAEQRRLDEAFVQGTWLNRYTLYNISSFMF